MTNTIYYMPTMGPKLEKTFLANVLFNLKAVYDISIIILKFQIRKLKFTEGK